MKVDEDRSKAKEFELAGVERTRLGDTAGYYTCKKTLRAVFRRVPSVSGAREGGKSRVRGSGDPSCLVWSRRTRK